MSEIKQDLQEVERSLSTVSSDVRDIARDFPDAKSKLYSLENEVDRLLSDVRKIRMKIESETN
jgi:predicted  nucleic acid-binding Zn-ribbon protein